MDKDEAKPLVKEIREGMYGIHAGPRTVVAKVINAGYYWPGMHLTALEEICRCHHVKDTLP
jgi:hypothetical protein